MLYYILRFLVQPLYWLVRMPKVYGIKNTKAILKGSAIVICNHRTMKDPVFLACILPRFIHFMAKKELFDTWIGKWFFRGFLVFPVDRGNADMKSMKKAMEVLKENRVFGIFPEGKRCVTDETDAFEKGAAFLAIKAQVPILPTYIPKDNFKLFKRPRLYIGDVITPEEYAFEGSKSAAINRLTALFEERVDELRELAGDWYAKA